MKSKQQERVTYVALTGLFLSAFAAFSTRKRYQQQVAKLGPVDLALLSLATYRLGHLASYDKITESIRRPFTRTMPDGSGAGDTTASRGRGVQRAIGELLACPTCTGTWAAAGLVYGLGVAPTPTRTFITIMGATGAAELLNALSEAWTWTGQQAREQVGAKESQDSPSL